MSNITILSQTPIVDNPLSRPRYTRQQNRIGGIRSGDTRRFKSRHVHHEIVRLNRWGVPVATIAERVGRAASTVYDLLSGTIRRCLTAAETKLLGPWQAGKFQPIVNHYGEVSKRNSVSVQPAPKHRQHPAKHRWNWCQPDCDRDHRHWYSPFEWARRQGRAQEYWDKATEPQADGMPCDCGFARLSVSQVCLMCGRR